jgi:TonB family protein
VPAASSRSTPLEVKAAKYTVFFKQVKQRVDERLVCPDQTSKIVNARADTGPGWQSRLRVVMTADGAVQAVTLETPSGRDDVDRAALAAMRTAGPFIDPPRQLFAPDGTAEFKFGVGCVAAQPGP